MDWRRWDSLEKQSRSFILELITPQTKMSNDLGPREFTKIEPNYKNAEIKLNLDPFRKERSKGWLSNKQYANLLAQRAVVP